MSVDPETLRARFDAPAPMTVGVEEELMLLDPSTLDLAPAGARGAGRARRRRARFTLELPAAQLEIMLPPARDRRRGDRRGSPPRAAALAGGGRRRAALRGAPACTRSPRRWAS